MTRTRIFITVLAIGTGFASAALASERHKSTHPKDFFARVSDDAPGDITSSVPQAAARPDCFVSYTPAEATRSIRHWTGKCR